MSETTFTEVQRLQAEPDTADVAFQMEEDAFRGFYDRTSRALWSYLARVTGDRQQADDLMQETYYRFLRASAHYESDAHRRNALFHIATNLVRDARRRTTMQLFEAADISTLQVDGDHARRTERRTDLERAMAHLKPRERTLLWLAYAQGESHKDIATTLGLKTGSIKLLLFRARRRLADLLRGART
ncbi:MAG TPA: sigma-70 family RNA polymerase sigma factor [Vicinamibacterales bacterium]|nr:sigma-70 family RNA polymerase sigma factor [Vicinamibacterales bacterium]